MITVSVATGTNTNDVEAVAAPSAMVHYALQQSSAFVRPSTAAATLPGTLNAASPLLASPSVSAQRLPSFNNLPTALAAPPVGVSDDVLLGPYALLKKLFAARARVRIYLRRDQELRGYCDAHIKAFDKHLNMYNLIRRSAFICLFMRVPYP